MITVARNRRLDNNFVPTTIIYISERKKRTNIENKARVSYQNLFHIF